MVNKALAAIAIGLGGIASIATAAAFFGGFWWGIDLLANYRWQMMWAALLASVVYALTGKGLFTAVFIVTAAINLWTILPAWTGNQPTGTGEDVIRIVHIDLSGTPDEMSSIDEWLLDQDADLVLVAGITTDQLAPLVTVDSTYTLLTGPGSRQGVAVFGRDSWQHDTTVSVDGQPIHVISVPSGTRVIDVVTGWGSMGTSQPTSDALWQRFRHLTDVVEDTNNPVAVIGSLGATRWAAPSRYLLTNSALRDATAGAGYLSTSPISDVPIVGRWIGIPIDVAYIDPELTPLSVVVGPDIGAEHLPMVIEVSPVAP